MFLHYQSPCIHVPPMKVDKYEHFVFKTNDTYRTNCNMIVCRQKHFLDRRSVRNKHVFVQAFFTKTAKNQCL